MPRVQFHYPTPLPLSPSPIGLGTLSITITLKEDATPLCFSRSNAMDAFQTIVEQEFKILDEDATISSSMNMKKNEWEEFKYLRENTNICIRPAD